MPLTDWQHWLEKRAKARQEFFEHVFQGEQIVSSLATVEVGKAIGMINAACSEFLRGWDADFPEPYNGGPEPETPEWYRLHPEEIDLLDLPPPCPYCGKRTCNSTCTKTENESPK